jgi:ferredoxin
MIVAERKPFEQIRSFLAPYGRVLVLGCGSCVTVCHAGGEREVAILAAELRIASQRGNGAKTFLEDCVTRQCDPEFLEPILKRLDEEEVEVVLSLACGAGVNLLAELLGRIPVFPALDTKFLGATVAPGTWAEMCAGCGDCILHLTGGICPVARCTKSLMNGPCGGTQDGKCEISPDVACGWVRIIERMQELGALDQLDEIVPPRDWSSGYYGGPRRLVHEHLQDLDETAEGEPAPVGAVRGGSDEKPE